MSFATHHDPFPGLELTTGALARRLGTSPVLLAVWAHPDDESFLGAGLVAEVASRGGRVATLTATAGEAGIDGEAGTAPSTLDARRRSELDHALAALGAEPAHILGYGDGACDQVPDALGARLVGTAIDRLRPDVVLGFGPDGVTGHPDHRAVARWTAAAVAARGGRVPLLTSAAGSTWPLDCVERLHEIDAFWPGYPDRLVDGDRITAHLDDEGLDRKLAALACHGSQIRPVQDVLGPERYRRLAATEGYHAANAAARRLLHAARRAAA